LTVCQIRNWGLDDLVGVAPRHNGEVTTLSSPDQSSASGAPTGPDGALDDEERSRREADLRSLIELMRPSVQADGGDLDLVAFDVATGVVQVELRGACSSCAISSATLQGGVDRILRGRLDWITEVQGGVDESMDFSDSAAMGRGGYVPRS
jgi:Fe-S cluster biogenesis protein NfuA